MLSVFHCILFWGRSIQKKKTYLKRCAAANINLKTYIILPWTRVELDAAVALSGTLWKFMFSDKSFDQPLRMATSGLLFSHGLPDVWHFRFGFCGGCWCLLNSLGCCCCSCWECFGWKSPTRWSYFFTSCCCCCWAVSTKPVACCFLFCWFCGCCVEHLVPESVAPPGKNVLPGQTFWKPDRKKRIS